jgi:YfiH family protein
MPVLPADLMRARQVHAATVTVGRRSGPLPEADILIAREEGLAVAVQAADCIPLLIADVRTGVVAAAHAGWRGLAVRVPGATVAALAREFGSQPSNLVAALGPSIGACCYEVGPEMTDCFVKAGFSTREVERWFLDAPLASSRNPPAPGLVLRRRVGHRFFDGWTAGRDQLAAAGVPPDQIFSSSLCTASHPGTLCSFRRDGPSAGRMAAVIKARTPHPSQDSPSGQHSN